MRQKSPSIKAFNTPFRQKISRLLQAVIPPQRGEFEETDQPAGPSSIHILTLGRV